MHTEYMKLQPWQQIIQDSHHLSNGMNVEHFNKQLCKLMYVLMSRIFGENDAK